MKKKSRTAVRVFTLTILICVLALSCIAYAAPPASTQKPASQVQAVPIGGPSPLINRNAPPPGTITITSPASGVTWYAGSRYEIQWTCTGSCSLVDVTLWYGGVKTFVVGTGIGSGRTSYTVPTNAAAGSYELRVTSDYDTGVEARQPVTVVLPSITITTPKPNEQLSTGTQYTIRWTYTGDPGQVDVYQGEQGIIARSVAGSMGQGSVTWSISDSMQGYDDVMPGSHKIVIKSKSNPSIPASSVLFNLVCKYGTCNKACKDFQSDPYSCGFCDHRCGKTPSAYNCVNGSCVCKPTNTMCGSQCVDLNGDNDNCGTCGTKCATEKGFRCVKAACAVSDPQKYQEWCTSLGLIACGNNCVDCKTDPQNCGRCGNRCPAGQVCSGSKCVSQ